MLSQQQAVRVNLPFLGVKDGRPVGLDMEVTRGQFEDLAAGLLHETEQAIDQALEDAGLTAEEIDDILLVGGSTRIPYVRQLVERKFGKKPRTDIHPNEAVVLGAAIQAGLKSNEQKIPMESDKLMLEELEFHAKQGMEDAMEEDIAFSVALLKKHYPALYRYFEDYLSDLYEANAAGLNREMRRMIAKGKWQF